MKQLYEGILADVDTSIGNMDADLEKIHVFEWLEYNAEPIHYGEPSSYRCKTKGKVSDYEDWKDYVTVNNDGSVDFRCGINIKGSWEAHKMKIDEYIPFKIGKVNYVFEVSSNFMLTSNLLLLTLYYV